MHTEASLRDENLSVSEQHLRGFDFELQIHTLAQHAWSVVSHPIVYKPIGTEPPRDVASRVFRAVALVSLFDDEVQAANEALQNEPGYESNRMLMELDRQFAEWRIGETDDGLSLQVLDIVRTAYSEDEVATFSTVIGSFVGSHRSPLDAVFKEYGPVSEDYPLLFQPESLAIYERLHNAKARLRASWLASPLPIAYLEDVAAAFVQGY